VIYIYCVFLGLKILGILPYRGGATEFFFLNKNRLIFYSSIYVNAQGKVYCNYENMIAASSFRCNADNYKSLF
jgi:hypothetical protein